MVRFTPGGELKERFEFWLLKRLEAWTGSISLHSCWPRGKDLEGFDWTNSRTCNPAIQIKSVPTSFLGDFWDQECKFFRPGSWQD